MGILNKVKYGDAVTPQAKREAAQRKEDRKAAKELRKQVTPKVKRR